MILSFMRSLHLAIEILQRRYIRMCVRITAVTSFWALLILVPIYGTGATQEGAEGWYHISIANISIHSWRMWVPPIFACFFSGFTFFVMKQEYKHFMQLRMVSIHLQL